MGSTRVALVTAIVAGLSVSARAATLGFVDDFSTAGSNGWSNGSLSTSNPGADGVDGAADGYLRISTSFASNFGARTNNLNYQGDWIAAGITEMSLWLNDVGLDQAFEIHVLISDGVLNNTFQYNEGFQPAAGCWERFQVDMIDSSKWTQTRGNATFEAVLRSVERVTIRHDRAPFSEFPDSISGDLGIDQIMLGALAVDCPASFADDDRDGDVDQADFGAWQACYSGECGARPAACACFDRDGDGHVAADDLDAFLACVSGPDVPAAPGCGG